MITFSRQFGRGRHLTAATELLFAAGLCTVQSTQCRRVQMVCRDQPACTYKGRNLNSCGAVGRLAPGDYSPNTYRPAGNGV